MPTYDHEAGTGKPPPTGKPEAAPQGERSGMMRRLKGLGYEEGRSLLSPRGDEEVPADGSRVAGTPPPDRIVPEGGESEGAQEQAGTVADPRSQAGQEASFDTTGVASIPPARRRMVRLGSRGKEVAYAQERLNAHGAVPVLTVDGIFGPRTRQAAIDYQNSHALAADAVIGPKTWASLDGPTQVGTSGASGSTGGGGGPGSTMLYDNTSYTVPPPPPGTRKDVPLREISQKQSAQPPDLGPTIKVEGSAPGSDTEVHLYWVIAQLGSRARWASEVDLVTQVGFVPKGGGPAPQGRVTLRMDGQGNATASLIGPGGAATVANTYGTREAAIAGLKASFGFADVVDGDATFTLDELNKVQAALGRLSAGESAALRGVVLKRMHSLDENGKAASGVFKTDHRMSADNRTATSEAVLMLADSAFSSDMKNFIGGATDAAPISFQTILHEVGHAVEEAERYKARKKEYEATAEVNRKLDVFNAQVIVANDALKDLNAAWKAAIPLVQAYKGEVAKTGAKYVKAVDAANGKLGELTRNRSVSQRSRIEGEARKAIADRDAARAALAKSSAGHPALADLADTSSRQDDSLKEGLALAAAHADWEAAKADRTAAGNATKATETGGQTKRLKKFADFVARERIPPLTNYAKTSTAEFYAEAFSLWRADPEYLLRVAPKLHGWFAAGEHLK